MYNKKFNSFLQSPNYLNYEKDATYIALNNLLIQYLPDNIYLEVEDLLHAEIIFKVELGFRNGFRSAKNMHHTINETS